MTDRRKSKTAKGERNKRLASALIPVFFFLALAAVVIVCAVMGSRNGGIEAEATPAPTHAPYAALISRLHERFGGELVNADNFSSLAFKSPADGQSATVSCYLKSGLLCLSVVRTMSLSEATPEPTEDIFGDNAGSGISDGRTNSDLYLAVADEIAACLSEIHSPEDREATILKISEMIEAAVSGEAKKAQMLYGIYTVELSYSRQDRLLSVVCEPA